MKIKIITFLIMMIMITMTVSGANLITDPEEIDDLLLDSLQNNWFSFEEADTWENSEQEIVVNATYNVTANFSQSSWIPTIDYVDKAISSVDPDVDKINRIGAFSISFNSLKNNNKNLTELNVSDNFIFQWKGQQAGFLYSECSNFSASNPCLVYYELTQINSFGNYAENIKIYQTAGDGMLNRFNMTLDLFQFETKSGLSFQEKAQNITNTNVASIQEKVLGVTGRMETVADFILSIALIMFWIFKISILITGLFLAIIIPFKIIDLLVIINKKYVQPLRGI